jgi:hypothetical protein
MSRLGLDMASKRHQEACFASSVRTNQRHRLALGKRQAYAMDSNDITIAAYKIGYL